MTANFVHTSRIRLWIGHMNAFSFLEELPPTTVDRVYSCPWTCQAVYQSLPRLAKLYAMRLLCVQEETRANVKGWSREAYSSKHKTALEKVRLCCARMHDPPLIDFSLQLRSLSTACAGAFFLGD